MGGGQPAPEPQPSPPPPPPPPPPPENLINKRCFWYDNTAYYLDAFKNNYVIRSFNLDPMYKSNCQNACENDPQCKSGMLLNQGIGGGNPFNFYEGSKCYLLNVPLSGGGCSPNQGCTSWNCPDPVSVMAKKCVSKDNHAQCLSSFRESKVLRTIYGLNRTLCQEVCDADPECKSGMWNEKDISGNNFTYKARHCYLLKEPMEFCGCDPSQGCNAWDCYNEPVLNNKCTKNHDRLVNFIDLQRVQAIKSKDIFKVYYDKSKNECKNLCENDPGCLAAAQGTDTFYINPENGTNWTNWPRYPPYTCLLLRKNFTLPTNGGESQTWNCNVPDCSNNPPNYTTNEFLVEAKMGGVVIGSNPYEKDTDWRTAVIHAGLLEPGEKGYITLTKVDRQDYIGSTKKGVTSESRNSNSCGFTLTLKRKWEFCTDVCNGSGKCCDQARCIPIIDTKNRLKTVNEKLELNLTALKTEVDRLTTEFNRDKAAIEAEIKTLIGGKNSANSVLLQIRKQKELEKNQLISEFANDLEQLNNAYQDNIRRLKENMAKLTQKSVNEITKKYDEIEAYNQSKLTEVNNLLNNIRVYEASERVNLINNLTEEKNRTIAELKRIADNKEVELGKLLFEDEEYLLKEISRLNKIHSENLQKAKEDSDKKIQAVQVLIDKQTADFNAYRDKIDSNIKEIQSVLKKTEENYMEHIKELEDKIKEREEYNRTTIQKIHDDYTNKIEHVNTGSKSDREKLLIETRNSIEIKLDEINSRKQEINEEFLRKKRELQIGFIDLIEQQSQDYKARLNSLNLDGNKIIDELSTINDEYINTFEETRTNLLNLNVNHRTMIQKMGIELKEIQDKYRKEFIKKVEELEANKIKLITDSQNKLISEIEILRGKIVIIEKEVYEEMETYNKQTLDLITELENEKIEVIKKQNMEIEEEIEKLNNKYLSKRLDLQKELEEIIQKKITSQNNLLYKKIKLKELLAKRQSYSLISENIELTFYITIFLVFSILILTGFIIYDKSFK